MHPFCQSGIEVDGRGMTMSCSGDRSRLAWTKSASIRPPAGISAERGQRGVAVTLEYLRALEPHRGVFRFRQDALQ